MTNPKEVLNDFAEKFSYNGEPKVVEPYERLDYDQWVYIKQFIISSQIATLTSQLEAIPEDEEIPTHSDSDIECYKEGINQERQRQRQELQLAIKEWSELK